MGRKKNNQNSESAGQEVDFKDMITSLKELVVPAESDAPEESEVLEESEILEDPLISIIIPAYNARDTINKAVQSACAQTYQNIEILVVDDGSSDDTAKIVQDLQKNDSRIKLFKRENRGVSAARNAGLKNARGTWFVTLDDDDFIDPGMLYAMYDHARVNETDLEICGFRKIYPNGLKKEFRAEYDYADEKGQFLNTLFIELYDKHMICTHANKLYRTKLVREHDIYYNENIAVNEDIDFIFRFMQHTSSMGVIKPAFFNYVQHDESLISTYHDYGVASALLVACECRMMLVDAGVKNYVLRAADDRFFVHICSFVGLMYKESGITKNMRLLEIRELCSHREFLDLLKRVRPSSLKSMAAKMLLMFKRYDIYDSIYALIYGGKGKALKEKLQDTEIVDISTDENATTSAEDGETALKSIKDEVLSFGHMYEMLGFGGK